MTPSHSKNLGFQALEVAFHVRDIATTQPQLKTCNVSDTPLQVRKLAKALQIDHVPVRDGNQIVGVLEPNAVADDKSIRETMRELSTEILVSSDMPLLQFLPAIADTPYFRLVLEGTEIVGIVTRSDLQATPVRALAFGVVTHLEGLMASQISALSSDDSQWLERLSDGRRRRVEEKFRERARSNLQLSKIEYTDFCDKRDILRKMFRLDSAFEKKMKRIECLRDKLAHAGEFITSPEDIADVVENLREAQYWIEKIPGLTSE